MRPLELVREALRTTRASAVSSSLMGLVILACTFAAVLTVGRQAAAEDLLADGLAGPAARTLTVTQAGSGATLTPPVLAVLSALRGVAAAVATELPVDAVNGRLGAGSGAVAVVGVHGDVAEAIDLLAGRWPGPGEVVLPEGVIDDLHFADAVGYLEAADGTQWSVVGRFAPRAPFDSLASVAVTSTDLTSADTLAGFSFHEVRVVADAVEHVDAVQSAALAIIGGDPSELEVRTAAAGAAMTQQVSGVLAQLGRRALIVILAVGGALVAAVVLADVLVRRRDLGRRRTLGATRGDLVALVAVRSAIPAAVGAATGAGCGCLELWRSGGPVPLEFAAGVAVLGLLTALAACVPPAAFAAGRDPVQVMRTP